MKEVDEMNVIVGMIKTQKFGLQILMLALVFSLLIPLSVEAKYKGEVAAWLPWFAFDTGIESAEDQLDTLDTLYLFVYEIDVNGQIVAKTNLNDRDSKSLLRKAKRERIDIIPTIAWFDGAAIHDTLSDPIKRKAHIKMIVDLVDYNNYDGIDIDYEQKEARTIDYFSAFLKELEDELGRDDLVCTIEARMRPESRWRTIPNKIEYANDYKAINKYCDRIQVMAYDQQRADLIMNDKRKGVPYMPVADKDWVESVLDLALEDFDANKTMLGVATYGRAWDITVAPEWYRDYTRVATLNQPRILELSEKYESPIGRSEGGEAVISYFSEDSVFKVLNVLPVPEGTPKGYEAAAKALFFATRTGMEVPVRFVTWSDAKAVEDKVKLAEKYKLEGVSIFKIDGEEDQGVWSLF